MLMDICQICENEKNSVRNIKVAAQGMPAPPLFL